MRFPIPLAMAAGCLILAAGPFAQAADNFPTKPIDVIVPYSAGGGVNNMARAFAVEAAKDMGQQWVILNREGGGGVVGFNALANARPDGYTIGFSPASPMTNAPFVNPKIPFRNDQIQPVCQVFENVFAIAVKPDSPITDLKDLIERARKAPKTVSYGHAGPASVGQFSIAAIEQAAHVQFNAIPYRGDGPALADALGGTIDFASLGVGTLAGQNMRVLAIFSKKRHPALPDVPSIAELGYPTVSQGLNGLYVPNGTPGPIVKRFEAVCAKVVASREFIERASAQSQVPAYLDTQAFSALIDHTYKSNAQLVKTMGLTTKP